VGLGDVGDELVVEGQAGGVPAVLVLAEGAQAEGAGVAGLVQDRVEGGAHGAVGGCGEVEVGGEVGGEGVQVDGEETREGPGGGGVGEGDYLAEEFALG